ncbi:hypothetical protein CYMTET_44621 [Cymbomonas tetramitiformis]|uniref:Uncharacterized protein n=1 Tax=Cymbomonas tetramitiformis TaxID=36881 RepID=A0AAE0F0H2_9CHLO|nr:hypothetical protein CYMTET_44621 [Cymbomonas tetramitiformis]
MTTTDVHKGASRVGSIYPLEVTQFVDREWRKISDQQVDVLAWRCIGDTSRARSMDYYRALYGSRNCGTETTDIEDAPSLTEMTAAVFELQWPEKEAAMHVLKERLGKLVDGLNVDDPVRWEWTCLHTTLGGCLDFLRSRRITQQHVVVDARCYNAHVLA